MIWLVKLPTSLPSIVRLSVMVGFVEVLQHTPLAVTPEIPSEDTVPPQSAAIQVILLTAEVLTVGVLTVVIRLR